MQAVKIMDLQCMDFVHFALLHYNLLIIVEEVSRYGEIN